MNSKTMINKIKNNVKNGGQIFLLQNCQPGGFGIGFKKWDLQKVLKNDKQFKIYIGKISKNK